MHYTKLLYYTIHVCTAISIQSQDNIMHVHITQLPDVIHDIITNQAILHSCKRSSTVNHEKQNVYNHMHIVYKTHEMLTKKQLSQLKIGYTNSYNNEHITQKNSLQYNKKKAYNDVITLLEHKADPCQLYTGYYIDTNGIQTWNYDADIKELINAIYPCIASSSYYEDLPLSIYTKLNVTDIACIALAADNIDLPCSLIKQHCNFSTPIPLQSEKRLYSHIYLHALELYIRKTQPPSEIRKNLRTSQKDRFEIGESNNIAIVNSVLGISEWNLPGYEGEMCFNLHADIEHDHPIMPGADELNNNLMNSQYTETPFSVDTPDSKACFFPDMYIPSLYEQKHLARFIQKIHTKHPHYLRHVRTTAHHLSESGQITPNILEQIPSTQRTLL